MQHHSGARDRRTDGVAGEKGAIGRAEEGKGNFLFKSFPAEPAARRRGPETDMKARAIQERQ